MREEPSRCPRTRWQRQDRTVSRAEALLRQRAEGYSRDRGKKELFALPHDIRAGSAHPAASARSAEGISSARQGPLATNCPKMRDATSGFSKYYKRDSLISFYCYCLDVNSGHSAPSPGSLQNTQASA